MITFTSSHLHWNYFLALEQDLIKITRYVEFSEDNLKTYSVEFAHLLLSASSEVDVLLKQICQLLDPAAAAENMDQYRKCIVPALPGMMNEEIILPRYGMRHRPWLNWNADKNPDWWTSHNKVKHERHRYFKRANLQHTVNALGGLLIAVVYYYRLHFSKQQHRQVNFMDTTRELGDSSLLRINANYYYQVLIT